MIETVFYWLLVFSLVAGFWFVYAIVVTEIHQRRKRRRRTTTYTKPARPKIPRHQTPLTVQRGYDHPQLFYDDSLLRIRALESDAATKQPRPGSHACGNY
jgi:hypothetical protein